MPKAMCSQFWLTEVLGNDHPGLKSLSPTIAKSSMSVSAMKPNTGWPVLVVVVVGFCPWTMSLSTVSGCSTKICQFGTWSSRFTWRICIKYWNFAASSQSLVQNRLFEDIEPLNSFENPCGSFLRLEILAGVVPVTTVMGRLFLPLEGYL